jgi:hypothetical protein
MILKLTTNDNAGIWVNLSRILQMTLIDAHECRDLCLRNTGRYRAMDQNQLTLPRRSLAPVSATPLALKVGS